VDAAALRHRSLQELRNMQFRLRQRAVERGAEPAVLWGGILASLPKLTVTLEILLGDRLAAVRSDRGAVLREAGRELGLTEQIEPFTRLHRTDPRPEDLDVVALAGGYLALLDQLARRLESEGR
jgi:hypothetical protein